MVQFFGWAMKKLTLTIACLLACGTAVFAQGLVNSSEFISYLRVETNTAISPLFGGTGAGGTNGPTAAASANLAYDFELLYQPYPGNGPGGLATDTNVWDGTWNDLGASFTNSNTAGQVSASNGGTVSVPWSPGTTNSIVLIGWSANLGDSWLSVSNELAQAASGGDSIFAEQLGGQLGFFGESTFGYVSLPSSPLGVLNGMTINDPNMQLYALPVPEPRTLTMVSLGGLVLLSFRRLRRRLLGTTHAHGMTPVLTAFKIVQRIF